MKTRKLKIEFTGERLIPELNKGYAFFYEHLARYLFSCQFAKNKVILDAGCGVGYGSFIIATYGKAKKVYGVDLSNEAIQYAKQKYQEFNLHFIQDNLEELESIKNNSIDIALAFEVIEHTNKPDQSLERIRKKLKSGGVFVVSTPNKNTYPKGNPYHVKEYYPKEFMDLLNNYFKYVKIFHQCFEFTQNIKEESEEILTLEESFVEFTGKIFTPTLNIKDSQYLLAVCSDSKLPVMNTIAVNSCTVDGFDLRKGITSLIKQYEGLKNQIEELEVDIINYEKLTNELKNELLIIKSSKVFKIRKIYHDLKNIGESLFKK